MERQQKPRFGPVTRVCVLICLSVTTGDLLLNWKASCSEVTTTISDPLTTKLTKDLPSLTDSLTITPRPPYMEGLTDMCPYSTLCTVGPKAKLSAPNRSCCMECSCHPYCWTIGTCCPDMPEEKLSRNTHSRDLTVPCQTQYELYNQHRRIPVNNDLGFVSYRVIDSCFMKGTNKSCFDNSVLEDYITVSDVKEEFIFKNRKCAACNGFTDVVRWSFAFWCKVLVEMELTSIETLNNYILSNCRVQSFPPLISHYGFNRCSDVIDFSNAKFLFECPRIEVPKSVLDSQSINPSTILNIVEMDLFVVKPVEFGYANNTYLVCINFYASLFSKQAAPKFAFEQTIVYILAINVLLASCVTWF